MIVLNKLYVDSDKKARTINKVETSFDEEKYRKTILGKRNKFAHVEECDGFDEKGLRKVIGDIPFTEENVLKYEKKLENIRNY
ncbi:MAG: hypothetical protein Q9M36_07760 [Sulfurovum sp.]|nr:hypothetical protein [Sulfurovum sp.]